MNFRKRSSKPRLSKRNSALSRKAKRRASSVAEYKKRVPTTAESEDDISTWGGASSSFQEVVCRELELEEEESVQSRNGSELTLEHIIERLHSKDHQPAGIENLGNTCYFNAVLQILASCKGFVVAVFESTARKASVLAMKKSLRQFFSNNIGGGVLTPRILLQIFRDHNPVFDNNHEHDASEAFNALLDQLGLEDETILNLFRVNFAVKRKVCINFRTKPVVTRKDTGYCLRLLCQNKTGNFFTSVNECLQHEFSWKDQGDELFLWEDDGKRYPFQQQTLIQHESLPQYLVIHLARFTVYKKDTQKLKHDILFSNTLDLAPYTTDSSCKNAMYSLQGIVTHAGPTAHTGHYTASIETSSGHIFKCNDEIISKKRKLSASGAYLLPYQRQENEDL